MNGSDILDFYRQQLAKARREGGDGTLDPTPLTISPWLAWPL